MKRAYNFNAGPSAMPLEVLQEAQAEFLDYAANAPLLHGLDQGGLGIAGGRLGEVLLLVDIGVDGPLPFLEVRQCGTHGGRAPRPF